VRPDIAEHTYWAFHYHVLEELPAAETASRLGLSVNQVYVAKFRVLERIRALFSELSGVEMDQQR
jgi:DNA-directed RNA polymerase specialized sigma24 family protein